MKCENMFCIYYSGDDCILKEISLDIQGNCQSCIYVDIKEKELKKYRQKALERLTSK